ncbi:tyrosine recombinase XerC [Caproiciproducens galactitolivorans]|uniref:Tyrosine recombinase XerD n=1 Tax=Caproiciproducens galactitolivorans TaxID=642589 RepID=A0A4Z0YAK4_9FIRM|nr:tyrosine recombinase XerC [Caproiciproducens galactitolivorans]QEY34070.1 tyrosine recombinase XerC [Caproiciproducens galactitolivorans]TGJ76515.1 tyrosine recombinase XerD [Caproiciproducens galactitolivorans]
MKPELLAEAPPIIKEFLGYMGTIRGKSPKTVEEYYFDLRTFFRYIKQKRNLVPPNTKFEEIRISDVDLALIKTITLTNVYEYMNFLATERNNLASTRSRKVSSLRTFFKYLTNKTGKLDTNPVQELETPKAKKSLPKYLTLEQCLELLSKVDGSTKERDYCILVLFLNCGMRLSELVSLNLNDVNHNKKTIRIVGKGNKERIVYLNEACIDAINRYITVRPKDALIDKNALFISKQRKRISPKTVQYLVKKYLSEIELEDYSVHKLRHTAATLMYQHGHVDIRVLKDILGHENLGTTEIYTHLSNEQMANASEANPLSHVKQREPLKIQIKNKKGPV